MAADPAPVRIDDVAAKGRPIFALRTRFPGPRWDSVSRAIDYARQAGVAIVAAAGNEAHEVEFGSFDMYPCLADGVICVGAVEATRPLRRCYSNWGSAVDIFAPTDIKVGLDPGFIDVKGAGKSNDPRFQPGGGSFPSGDDKCGGRISQSHFGTSASTPFVAGIAALVRAVNPSLNSDAVADILARTAWTDSPDPVVNQYVNGYRAVLDAAGGRLPSDGFEPNDSKAAAHHLGTDPNATWTRLSAANEFDQDWYSFTTTQYEDLEITVEAVQALNRVHFQFAPESQSLCGATEKGENDGGARQRFMAVAPGTHTFVVTADGPNVYKLTIHTTASRAAQPDQFEVNDRLGQASVFPGFGGELTLHSASDVDYFRTQFSAGTRRFYSVQLMAETPMQLDLLDAAGTTIATKTGKDIGTAVTAGGAYTIRVQWPTSPFLRPLFGAPYRAACYLLLAGAREIPKPPMRERTWWWQKGDPVAPWILTKANELISFDRGNARTIEVQGAVDVDLRDVTGAVLARGTPTGATGQRLDLSRSRTDRVIVSVRPLGATRPTGPIPFRVRPGQ